MSADLEYVRKHYAELSDEALMRVRRSDLVDPAQVLYDAEMDRRGLRCDDVASNAAAVAPAPRLRNVQRAALLACVATLLGIAIPAWNFARQMPALESKIGQVFAVGAILGFGAFMAIVPVFCFALYRNEGPVPISRRRRWVAWAAVAVIGLDWARAASAWIGSFRHKSVLDTATRSWTTGDTSLALGLIGDLAMIVLLVVLARRAGDAPAESCAATSRLLRVTARIAVITGAVVAVGGLIVVGATPWIYAVIRDRATETGVPITQGMFLRLAWERTWSTLALVSNFAAPLMVWEGGRRRSAGEDVPA